MRGKIWFGAVAIALAGIPLASHANAAPNEDDPGWSCVSDGNRVCGPGNSNGVPPGCYDDGGVMFAPWPCEAWKPSDGYRHGDGSWTEVQDGHAYLCVHQVERTLCSDDPDEYVYQLGYTN